MLILCFFPLFDNCRLWLALCFNFFDPPKLLPIDASVLLMLWLLCLSSAIRREREREGRVHFGNPLSIPYLGFSAVSLPAASAMRALTLSRSVLLGKRESYRERQSLFPVLVNHISVQFPSVLFGSGGMTGVIYHTD